MTSTDQQHVHPDGLPMHCKPLCQSSWNNIFAHVNDVISPTGSKTLDAMLNRLLFVSRSLTASILGGTLKRVSFFLGETFIMGLISPQKIFGHP